MEQQPEKNVSQDSLSRRISTTSVILIVGSVLVWVLLLLIVFKNAAIPVMIDLRVPLYLLVVTILYFVLMMIIAIVLRLMKLTAPSNAILIGQAVVMLGFISSIVWYFGIYGRPPAPRPDLITMAPPGAQEPPQGWTTRGLALVNILLGKVSLIDSKAPLVDGVVKKDRIEFGRVDNRILQLNLYSPEGLDTAVPGIIFVFGGGWSGGERAQLQFYAMHYAKAGYVTACIDYRLSGEAPFPGAIEDVKCAVRWMRSNAQSINVDPERIAISGNSSGGHLALMTAYSSDYDTWNQSGGHQGVSSAVSTVIALYAPFSLSDPWGRQNADVASFLATTWEDQPDLFELASPKQHLDAKDPPTLILHGTVDMVIPVGQSDALAERLKELNIPYDYGRLDGWPHAFDIFEPGHEWACSQITPFLEKHLGKGWQG